MGCGCSPGEMAGGALEGNLARNPGLCTGGTVPDGAGNCIEPRCTKDDDCVDGQVCENGSCTTIAEQQDGVCTVDSDCPAGESCLDNACVAVPVDDPNGSDGEGVGNEIGTGTIIPPAKKWHPPLSKKAPVTDNTQDAKTTPAEKKPGTPAKKQCSPKEAPAGWSTVSLVVETFTEKNFRGEYATFVGDTVRITMEDEIKSLKINKGPNYVQGDYVMICRESYINDCRWSSGPNSFSDLDDVRTEGSVENVKIDGISSLQFKRPTVANVACAEEWRTSDSKRWQDEIPLVIRVAKDDDATGGSMDIIRSEVFEDNTISSIGNDGAYHGLRKEISYIHVLKGPQYVSGSEAKFIVDGGSDFIAGPESLLDGLSNCHNDKITEIVFLDPDGNEWNF